jgi:aspartate oxidase
VGIKTLYHEEITPQYIETDFLVIGAGVAGLRAAIELAAAGRVLVLAKDSLSESSSEYAQGGIAASLSDDDEVGLHEQDTLRAGAGLCDADAVRALVEEGPKEIEQLIAWGAEFDREGAGLAFTREGAHSRSRILHAHGDSTGREIVRTLQQKAASMESIQMHSFSAVTDLLPGENAVGGVMALEDPVGRQVGIRSRAVLLATGGLGRVFINTTNPDVATGDGVAMAYRAGALLADLEFVQFHGVVSPHGRSGAAGCRGAWNRERDAADRSRARVSGSHEPGARLGGEAVSANSRNLPELRRGPGAAACASESGGTLCDGRSPHGSFRTIQY